MSQSLATRLSLLFSPARRLHEAVRALQTAQSALEDSHSVIKAEQTELADRVTLLSNAYSTQSASPTEVDRVTARQLQAASLRNMPFLPGDIAMTADGLRVESVAGAPEGLTDNMAFFVNGLRFDQVEYPIFSAEMAARFPDVKGMEYIARMTMTEARETLLAAPFWRFDAAPSGYYIAANWQQAIHFKNPAFERYPFPPPANMRRVIGDESSIRFAMGGATIFKNIENYLSELKLGWSDFHRILDWGCGAGRLTRYLAGDTNSSIVGVDIDADNVAWCRTNCPDARFEVVPLRPPTMFDDGEFDLVTGLSVMTHLREEDHLKWLQELRRITRPGALLFLSVQGPTQYGYNQFPAHYYRQTEAQGYLNLSRDSALDDVIADKEYYRATMYSRSYIVRRWAKYFDILGIVDAIAGLQDFVVLRR